MSVTPIRKIAPIGGSEAAAAAGIHPHVSRVQLWLEKTGRLERRETEAMRWGTALEPVIMEALREDGYGIAPLNPNEGEIADAERPWIIGHPDGFVSDEQGLALLEVKTANVWAARGWEGVPLEYAAQVQHYLHLTGLDRALLAVLVGGQRLEVHEIRREQRAIDLLLEREQEFWEAYILRDTAPPPDGSESARDAMLAMFPESREGGVVRLSRAAMSTLAELKRRKAQLATLKEQVTRLENELKLELGDAETAITPHDATAIHWRTSKTNRVDVERLKRDRPEIYAEYLTEGSTRRFTVL